jgi:hypothetical protein
LFNLFKFLKNNKNTPFKVNGVRVSVIVTPAISCQHIKYVAYLSGFEIVFEYYDYLYIVNKIGRCQILLNNVVIHQEPYNITLSKLDPNKYIKQCFKRLIHHVNQLDHLKLAKITPIFNVDIFNYISSISIHTIRKFRNVDIYHLSLTQKNDIEIPYNLRYNARDLNNIEIVAFSDTPFCHLMSRDKSSPKFIEASNAIYDNNRIRNHPEKYSSFKLGDNFKNSLYNATLNEALVYVVFKDSLSYSNNKIVLHFFWHVSFATQAVNVVTFIFDDEKFVGECSEPIESRFIENDIDLDYYKNFLEIFVEKLLLIYFPTQNLADFLSIPDFNGRLTEEQYSVFSMYSI